MRSSKHKGDRDGQDAECDGEGFILGVALWEVVKPSGSGA